MYKGQEYYGQIVQRTSIMRQLIATGGDIAAIGYEGAADTEAALSRAEDLLFRVRSGRGTRDFVHLREVLDTYMEKTASLDLDRDMRDRFRDHPYWKDCAEFCEKYDQNSFDPAYDTLALEHFEPLVESVFASLKKSIYLEAVTAQASNSESP